MNKILFFIIKNLIYILIRRLKRFKKIKFKITEFKINNKYILFKYFFSEGIKSEITEKLYIKDLGKTNFDHPASPEEEKRWRYELYLELKNEFTNEYNNK